MNEVNPVHAAVADILRREGIEYSAAFVPQSLSRNSAEKDKTLNWRVTFSRASTKQVVTIDYSQGIGHIPGYSTGFYRHTRGRDAVEQEAAEKGTYCPVGKYAPRRLPAPAAVDLVYCIVLDNPHEETFECWAAGLGYDVDSRKAEEIYRACIKQSRDAERVFGRAVLQELANLVEGY